jgi:hypothetical protein
MMGKRWTVEEEKIMAEFYPIVNSVHEVAEMIGRPVFAVLKKGQHMGLKRPDLHEVSVARLKAALDDTPRSSGELAERMGVTRNAANDLLRTGHKEKLCHVAVLRPAGGRGKDTPLWVAGPGENAKSAYAVRLSRTPITRKRERKLTEQDIRLQMLTNRFSDLSMALYGKPCIYDQHASLPGRVFVHLIDDDLEVESEAA